MIIFGERLGSIEAKLMCEKKRWNEAVRKGDRKETDDATKKFKKKLEKLEAFSRAHKLFLEEFHNHIGLQDQNILNAWKITNINDAQELIVAISSKLETIQANASVASKCKEMHKALDYFNDNILPAIERVKEYAKKEVAGLGTAINAVKNNPSGKLKKIVGDLLKVEREVRELE